MPTNTEAVRTLARGLRGLRDDQLACRDMRHAWTVDEDYHVVPSQSVGRKVLAVRRVLSCMRGCGTRRVENYNTTRHGLDKVEQHYVYADGYQIPGVPRGVKPSVIIQQESYRRAMERVAHVDARGETLELEPEPAPAVVPPPRAVAKAKPAKSAKPASSERRRQLLDETFSLVGG